jgi:hypothetical protein
MAASMIEQSPLLNILNILKPVGQDLIYVVSNQTAVANETRVKFVAEVYIGTSVATVTPTGNIPVGTFKTTPNNAGVGMFDLRNVVENYVKADNMAANGSKYKTTLTSPTARHPVHLIDKFSLNTNVARYMIVRFSVEYLVGTTVEIDINTQATSSLALIFNGYVKHTDILTKAGNNFAYDTAKFTLVDNSSEFLTNAPTTQYANLEDYGTLSMVTINITTTGGSILNRIRLNYFDSSGNPLGAEVILRNSANGAWNSWGDQIEKQILHFGCFPGNLQNSSTTFKALVTTGTIQGGSITVQALDSGLSPISQVYTIKLNCPNGKGYEPIRLCWLNQWGAWDYYTFTQKSIKSTSTSGATYNQLAGTWNESLYRPDSYKGGKKAFRVNATEKITMNSDFVTEDEAVIFEELVNSPEVYLLKGYEDIVETTSVLNQYVTPVRLLTSSFTKKTIANDKLMQYNFEIEKSKTLRTQAV